MTCLVSKFSRMFLPYGVDLYKMTWLGIHHQFPRYYYLQHVPLPKHQKRKPRSLGRAPSKDHRYFTKHWPTVKDVKKSQDLYASYNVALQSLVAAFQEKMLEKKQFLKDSGEKSVLWDEDAHHAKCMQYNNDENKRMHEVRLLRLEEEKRRVLEKRKEQDLELRSDLSLMEDVNKEALDQLKEEAKSWLTEETCEAEVTRAVDNPINPNFAVDQQGFIIRRTAQVV